MLFEHQSPYRTALLVIAALMLLGGGFALLQGDSTDNEQRACTLEAKLCPDGSYVGRTGPNCEFAACPEEQPPIGGNEGWKTITDSQSGVSFHYPEQLSTQYISTVDWPPQVQLLNESFTCTGAGSEDQRAGKTEKRMVDNRTYCVTRVVEGAAGSMYTMYAYAFPKDSQTVIFTFSLRASQCANYDEPQKTACEQENVSFDIDSIVDRMAQSVSVTRE